MYFLKVVLCHKKYNFDRILYHENLDEKEKIRIAKYIYPHNYLSVPR